MFCFKYLIYIHANACGITYYLQSNNVWKAVFIASIYCTNINQLYKYCTVFMASILLLKIIVYGTTTSM